MDKEKEKSCCKMNRPVSHCNSLFYKKCKLRHYTNLPKTGKHLSDTPNCRLQVCFHFYQIAGAQEQDGCR